MRAVALSVLLAGCVSEERFTDDFIVAQCSLLLECQGTVLFDDTAACEAQYADWMGAWTQGCSYDPYLADDCIAAVESATCEDGDAVSGACDPVFTGDCPWAD